MEVLPGQFVSSAVALLRFSGERHSEPKSDLARLAKLARERFDKQIRRAVALKFLDERAAANDAEAFTADRIVAVADIADEIKELDRRMAAPGSVVQGQDHA